MPHLEEQFPPVKQLVLQRPDAVDPPDRAEDEDARPIGGQAEDEIPLPGSLADGIDRVTISANARVIVPVQPNEETVPLPADLTPGESEVNPVVPELLDIEIQDRDGGAEVSATDENIGANLQNFLNVLETRRRVEASGTRTDLNPIESRPASTAPESTLPPAPTSNAPAAPGLNPATPLVQNATRGPRETVAPVRITAPETTTPTTNIEPEQNTALDIEERVAPATPPADGPALRGQIEQRNLVFEEIPLRPETQGLRGIAPVPREEGRVNILTPPALRADPTGGDIEETRNFGQGRTLSLNLATEGNDETLIAVDSVDEALEEAGAILRPNTPEPRVQILRPAAARPVIDAAPEIVETAADRQGANFSPTLPELNDVNAQRDPADIPGPEGRGIETSFLIDTRQVFEEDQETKALQAAAFPELNPDEPFVPDPQPEAREEAIPAVAQEPLNAPPPAFENVVPPVAPPTPSNVAALDENPQALRGDNLGTDPALRGNRELRNFLQEFNNRIEQPEGVTDDEGAPVEEVQNNAPPPPAVFENLEAESAELLDRVRERQATEGVTRPEEEHTAPPEPRTPESILTGRGQNIDQFI
jgi:hypothetical protein